VCGGTPEPIAAISRTLKSCLTFEWVGHELERIRFCEVCFTEYQPRTRSVQSAKRHELMGQFAMDVERDIGSYQQQNVQVTGYPGRTRPATDNNFDRKSAWSELNNQSSYRQEIALATHSTNIYSDLGGTTIATLSHSSQAFYHRCFSLSFPLSQESVDNGHWYRTFRQEHPHPTRN